MTHKEISSIAVALYKRRPPDNARLDVIQQWRGDVSGVCDAIVALKPGYDWRLFYSACNRGED